VYILNGSKRFITETRALRSLYTVFAKTDPSGGHKRHLSVFLVESDTPGFDVTRLEPKMGDRRLERRASSHSRTYAFPAANLLGAEGEGFKIANAHPRPLAFPAVARAGRSASRRAPRTTRSSTRKTARDDGQADRRSIS